MYKTQRFTRPYLPSEKIQITEINNRLVNKQWYEHVTIPERCFLWTHFSYWQRCHHKILMLVASTRWSPWIDGVTETCHLLFILLVSGLGMGCFRHMHMFYMCIIFPCQGWTSLSYSLGICIWLSIFKVPTGSWKFVWTDTSLVL